MRGGIGIMKVEQTAISIQYGDVDGDYNCEKVVLFGTPYGPNQSYIQQLELLIHYMNDKKLRFQLDLTGYDIHLFLGDFLKKNCSQILITGRTGGSGDYAIARLYSLENNKLKLILDEEDLSKKLTCQSGYINMNGALGITCPASGQTFMLENRGSFNPYSAYSGIRQDVSQPIVTAINTIYPIMQPYDNFYSLQTQQRIIGVNNADLLGFIQSVIQVTEEVAIIRSQTLVKYPNS